MVWLMYVRRVAAEWEPRYISTRRDWSRAIVDWLRRRFRRFEQYFLST